MTPPTLAAGDVGGTKTILALYEDHGGRLVRIFSKRYSSAGFAGLDALFEGFLREAGGAPPAAACFGVPGAVSDGVARATNLPWVVDSREIAARFRIARVKVMNDLAANATGLSCLAAEDFCVLQEGSPAAHGNQCVVSPGTGLGEAGLFWDGRRHRVWACEGGHADFAPLDATGDALRDYLAPRCGGRVSCERVVSGAGFGNICAFLRDSGRAVETPEVTAALAKADPGHVVSEWDGRCSLCTMAMNIFVRYLAAEAGNMALSAMATGGVFLGGGIPGKILPRLQAPAFIETFRAKGRLSPLLEAMPVKVVLNDEAALLGAARAASELLAA